ncbi:hypothetical protein [Bacillus sp. UNC438CL73TsuS30]|uniref:hypothetical protein n=1 Tax=Bacillus sp. UNC438CL73TsuS30 TaxID=1340434 RepID=UPI00047CD6EA|nr:hypothetical protein [Bacillus sp. UNC438CL73TsuS30]
MGQATKKEFFQREPRQNRIIVCEDMDFVWDKPELKALKKMWEKELSVNYIADYFDRDPDEILVALIHLARNDKIARRKEGLV